MEINLTGIQVIDLFFRFSAVGQLFVLIVFLTKKYKTFPAPQVSIVIAIVGYILLTAPIENQHYGGLRNVLLLITDLTPFAALWYVASQLNNNFKLVNVPKVILVPTTLWVLSLVYFFLVLGGRGLFHDFNHAVGIGVLITTIYLCLSEYIDDLDNRRRNARLLMVTFCSFYMLTLVMFEFFDKSIRDSWQFSVTNSFMIFALVLFACQKIIFNIDIKVEQKKPSKQIAKKAVTSELNALNELMKKEVFLEQELSIGKLAEMLNLPSHQLRLIINQQLQFSNFSHYLNSYRIPWVCRQLEDPSKKSLPILTLALEAGYGSIAPFNRAFKAQLGVTPKQYRDQF